MKDIRIPFQYVQHEDGRTYPLFADDKRRELEAEAKDAKVPKAVREQLSAELALDAKLRGQANAVFRVAVCRAPSYTDVCETQSSARRYDPASNEHILLPEREIVCRVEQLLLHVEEDGKEVGGIEAIPAPFVPIVGRRLYDHMYLPASARDFLASGPTS